MAVRTVRHIRIAILAIIGIIASGTIGYMVIENWSLLDSLYMTIISITTTGFSELHGLSNTGRIFTIFVIVIGVSTIAYTGGRIIQFFIENYFFRRRYIMKKIEDLREHYIVCGFGRMGKKICEELNRNRVPFVVVDNNPDEINNLDNLGYIFIEGDATNDNTLLQAGIKYAKGLVSCLPTETENVFTVLSARVLSPKVFIVSRAVEEETESKLIKAGANRVVKPYEIGGLRMAQVLLRPSVSEFIDIIAQSREHDLIIEEIEVKPTSQLVGQTLASSPIRKDLNIIIVAIFDENRRFIYNPKSNRVIQENEKLIVIGRGENIKQLIEIAGGK